MVVAVAEDGHGLYASMSHDNIHIGMLVKGG